MRATLAQASLIRHRARTMLAVLGVAVATAMLLDMVMLATGMRESFRELLLSRGFDIRLAPKGTLPFDTDATIPGVSAIMSALRTNGDIREISPVLGGSIHIRVGERDISAAVLGVEPTVQGDYEFLSGKDITTPNAIVVNDFLLHKLGARIGDTLDVAAGYDPQTRTYSGQRKLLLTGTVRFIYGANDQSAAAVRRATLEELGGGARRDRASLFMVRVRKGANPDSVRNWIFARIPTVSVISVATAIAEVDQRLSYFRQLAFILGAVSLFVGFLLVTTLVTVSVNERAGEIAVMRAIGVSRTHVVQQIVIEGVAISLVGAILGLGLGLITARYLNSILSAFPGLPMAIDFFLFQPRAAWSALGLLVASGILAGVYPAWRAASLPIAESLRREAIA
ncbi:MAG: putative transport system permease protein [Gemmatimonadaceae bacterium]|jgi:putative ABC transport system permease protein|nr:putative transport system permease protein [Gemmatimonadaceae bacterium]